MATTILIVCPECGKQVRAPEAVFGKKVRCKFCQAVFVARPGDNKGPPGKPTRPAATAKPVVKASPRKPAFVEEEEDDKPYELVDISLASRCPNCANEMDDEEATVCLICGYDTKSRQQHKTLKTYDTTTFEHFVWLLPGIACLLVVLGVAGFVIWYLLQIDEVVSWDNDPFYLGMWTIGGIKLWVVIVSLLIIYKSGFFAVKRLILRFRPPEVEKVK